MKNNFITQEDDRRSELSHQVTGPRIEDENSEGESSDADDFIVDDEGRPIREKRKKKHIFTDSYENFLFFLNVFFL